MRKKNLLSAHNRGDEKDRWPGEDELFFPGLPRLLVILLL
jgi:hypothetical protein